MRDHLVTMVICMHVNMRVPGFTLINHKMSLSLGTLCFILSVFHKKVSETGYKTSPVCHYSSL